MQKFAYDGLGRTKEISLGTNLVKDVYYAKYGDHATNRINSVWHGVNGVRKENTRYTYDRAGNIETVTDNGKLIARYRYDGLNRLVREDNVHFGTVTYQYDHAGNILLKTVHPFTLDDIVTVQGTDFPYEYAQHGWKDQLTSFNGLSCANYDALGNPTEYKGRTLSWQGRRLLSYAKDNVSANFTYDANGIRTSKTITQDGAAVTHSEYIFDGNRLVAEQITNNCSISNRYYVYGVDGVAGFSQDGETYLYRKNVQGDVTHIYKQEEDGSLVLVAQYVYDAWGNCKILLDVDGIATVNPFRYRSYYLDVETDLYYLQTRYYDPETGRFISADSIEYLDPETLGGLNLYAYCGNKPVMAVDPNGTSFLAFLICLAVTWAVSAILSHYVGEHFASGASSIVGGIQTISTGISLLGFGPVGWVLGGIALVVGAAQIAFGSAELQEHFTGNNWIKDAGVSNELYSGLYTGINIASAIVSIAGASYMTSAAGQRAYALQNVKKFSYTGSVKKHIGGYFGKRYGITVDGSDFRPYTDNLWAQKTIIKYGKMTKDAFGWVFELDGFRLGLNNKLKLIWHFGSGF